MVSSDRRIEVYCTRPGCEDPRNFISPRRILTSNSIEQRFCSNCRMPLIFKGYFLPVDLIGKGGFGRTFLANDLNSPIERKCVIKQLHPQIPPQTPLNIQRLEELFRQEANVLEQLHHDQIPGGLGFDVVTVSAYPQNQSPGISNNQQNFFYLVQEYIEGQNLVEELNSRGPFSESEVIEFIEQMLNVLNYIHNNQILHYQGIIHRDIKPHNIILRHSDNRFFLIDFGAVKQVVVAGVPAEVSCILGTPLYAPPEQLCGDPVSPSSDLYSLAATCVCLLTGRNPQELRHNNTWIWKQYANLNNDRLANILDRMLLPEATERPRSAQEVIDVLSNVEVTVLPTVPPQNPPIVPPQNPPGIINSVIRIIRRWGWLKYAFLAVLALVFAFAIHHFFFSHCSKYSCTTGDGFSWGEEVLIVDKSSNEKKKGTEEFGRGNYDAAIEQFKKSLKSNRNDPEALIDLNNAYAARTDNPIRIAVSIPINSKVPGLPEEMLRGVAHVQSEVNCGINNYLNELDTKSKFNCSQNGINGRFLQVLIANDKLDPITVKKVTKTIVENPNILGVIGPYSSKLTKEVVKTYEDATLNNVDKPVLISPTSTVVRNLLRLNNYVFRTAATDTTAAQDLVNYMRSIRPRPLTTAVIVKDPTDVFSKSLSGEFEKILGSEHVLNICIWHKNKAVISDCIRNNSRADVILLALTKEDLETHANDAFSGRYNLKVLGGDTLYSEKLKSVGNEAIENEKLVIAVPWHRSNDNNPFENTSDQLWDAKVNWRTAMTYDATKAMVKALENTQKNNPSRLDLYKALSKDDFYTEGATAKVEFDGFGDRKLFTGLGVLVKAIDSNPDPTETKLDFVILEQPIRNNS